MDCCLASNRFSGLPLSLVYARKRSERTRHYHRQYDPPEFDSGRSRTIVDEHAQNKDITAEIIYLATQGYLKIKQIEDHGLIFKSKDFVLELLKDDFSGLNEFQKIILRVYPKKRMAIWSNYPI